MVDTAHLKQCNKLLERVARALELLLFHRYGIRTGHLQIHADHSSFESRRGKLKTGDQETFRQRLIELAGVLADRSRTDASKHWHVIRYIN
jgi:hypothetical protein